MKIFPVKQWKGSVLILATSFALFILAVACQKQADTVTGNVDINQLKVEPGFNWATTQDVPVSITAKDNLDGAIEGVRFTLYTANPDSGGVYLVSGVTGKDGVWNSTVSLPKGTSKVTVYNNFIGLIRQMDVPVSSAGVSSLFGGKPPVSREKKATVKGNGPAMKSTNAVKWVYMSGYDSQGVPSDLMSTNDPVTQQLLQDLNAGLPEYKNEISYQPAWFLPSCPNNLDLSSMSDVYITYITEGAGWQNSLAYFTYNTNQPPSAAALIDTIHIIFPNMSNNGSGGGLFPGNKVYLGRFPAGKSIGLVVVPSGWNGNGTYIWPNSNVWYSIPSYNTTDPSMQKHLLLFNDPSRQQVLFTFEDMSSPQGSDKDFNDGICYITVNPIQAVNTTNMPVMATTVVDQDQDGVPDNSDDYPTDPTKAFNNFTPSKSGLNSLAFEDSWPSKGDYDFNDLVLSYRFNEVTNAQNQVVEIDATLITQAIGALYHNGFGFQLPITPDKVQTVAGTSLKHGYVNLSSNKTESGQSKAVIIAFDDAFDLLHSAGQGYFGANTVEGNPFSTPDTIKLVIKLSSPLALSQLGSPPYNPFIIENSNRNREIHLPDQPPTDKADVLEFGTSNDNSVPAQGRYYRTANNLPWAINIPDKFNYPKEKVAINAGFLKFNDWAISSGSQYNDWYKPLGGYRNVSDIYSH